MAKPLPTVHPQGLQIKLPDKSQQGKNQYGLVLPLLGHNLSFHQYRRGKFRYFLDKRIKYWHTDRLYAVGQEVFFYLQNTKAPLQE